MTFRFTTFLTALGIASSPAAVDFEKQILPIFENHCFECHSSAIKKPKGKVALDTSEALAHVAKETEWHWVLDLVKMPKGDPDIMPPEDKGTPLEKDQIALLEAWIKEGADIGTFTKYNHPEEKLVSGLGKKKLAKEIKTAAAELDAVVGNTLEKRGLKRNPEIDDATFLRRAYLELAGRNPTVAEAERFLKTDTADKRAILVEYLSDSDAYVSRHFNYWAKIFRADTNQQGNEQNAWFHYLKKSIAANTSYDEWTREMMTAEGLLWENPAIGFYQRDAKNRLAGYEAMTNVFLGTDIGCAQCHDHPTEPMSQLSYYKMNGFYEASHPFGEGRSMFTHIGSDYQKSLNERQTYVKKNRIGRRERAYQIVSLGFRSTYEFRKKVTAEDNTGRSKVPDTYRYEDVKHGEHLEPEPMFGIAPTIAKGEKPMFVFAKWVTDPQNLKFTHTIANRMWLKVMGAPVLGSPTAIIAPEASESPELAEHLAELMLACNYDLKKFQAVLLNTRTYQSESVAKENSTEDFAFQGPLLRRLSSEQIWDNLLTLINKNTDPPAVPPAPNFDFYLQARDVKTTDEYWKLVEKRLDYELVNNVGLIGGFGVIARSEAKTSRKGYDEDFLVRASELPSPAPDGHFLQIFGQGRRVQIEDHWDTATIPQALTLLNGNLHTRIANEDSAVYAVLDGAEDHVQTIGKVYLAALSRYPDEDELALAKQVTGDATMGSYFHLLWILLNTTEFVVQP